MFSKAGYWFGGGFLIFVCTASHRLTALASSGFVWVVPFLFEPPYRPPAVLAFHHQTMRTPGFYGRRLYIFHDICVFLAHQRFEYISFARISSPLCAPVSPFFTPLRQRAATPDDLTLKYGRQAAQRSSRYCGVVPRLRPTSKSLTRLLLCRLCLFFHVAHSVPFRTGAERGRLAPEPGVPIPRQ